MTCDYCIHSEEAREKKVSLRPGHKWRCPECLQVWVADTHGVWIDRDIFVDPI